MLDILKLVLQVNIIESFIQSLFMTYLLLQVTTKQFFKIYFIILRECFSLYYMDSDVVSRFKSSTTH